MPTAYEVLGVHSDAAAWEVRAAYRASAKRTHPDRQGGSAEAFRAVRAAYDILGDAVARRAYDEVLSEREASRFPEAKQEFVVPERPQSPRGPWVARSFALVGSAVLVGLALRGPVVAVAGVTEGDAWFPDATYDGSVGPSSASELFVLGLLVLGLTMIITALVGVRVALTGPPRLMETVLGLGYLGALTATAQVIFAGERAAGAFFFAVVGFVGWSVLGVVLERRSFAQFLHEHRES